MLIFLLLIFSLVVSYGRRSASRPWSRRCIVVENLNKYRSIKKQLLNMELLALYSCNLSWNIKLRGITRHTQSDIPKQTKAKGPQADLDTGHRLTPLAITLIFPPSCDHAFWRRASSPDKYMSMLIAQWHEDINEWNETDLLHVIGLLLIA